MLLRPVPQGVMLRLRVTPRGGADRIEGYGADASGAPHLRLRVCAVAEKGKANDAALKLLARAWRLPRSSLAITAGETGRTKQVTVSGDTAVLLEKLGAWLDGHAADGS
ncbi:MAG: hypothetical protein CVT73_00895 [Alphaproteobacteria bacterium HGW-Alphaproteobacteria-12]|nr:MAG: hypothetical protein CVT73_00895 [Alphaproteobacteria bacterium HGW-Alphaproteobacteria-12]